MLRKKINNAVDSGLYVFLSTPPVHQKYYIQNSSQYKIKQVERTVERIHFLRCQIPDFEVLSDRDFIPYIGAIPLAGRRPHFVHLEMLLVLCSLKWNV